MAKPIFLVGFPIGADPQETDKARQSLSLLLNGEYHVIVYRTQEIKSISFQVLNAINSTDVEIEELIEMTKNHINQLEND